MRNRHKRRIIWLNEWHICEQETWFADMAAQGWRLVDIGNIFAIFEQFSPKQINYKCDIFDPDDPAERKRIQYYRELGWKYIATRKHIRIFQEIENGNSKEIPIDPVRQRNLSKILKKDIKKKVSNAFLATLLAIVLQFFTLQIDPIGNYLRDGFIFFLIIAIFYISSIMPKVTSMVQLSKIMKQLDGDGFIVDGANYQLKMHQKRLLTLGTFIFSVLFIIYALTSMFSYPTEDDISQDHLNVVQLSDVIDQSEYENLNEDWDSSLYLDYSTNTSFLVPKQSESYEIIDVVSKDTGQTYSPTILSNHYEARNKWISKQFIRTLRKNSIDDDDFGLVTDERFDELWVKEIGANVEVLVRSNHVIHEFSFYNTQKMEQIVEKTLMKIDKLLAESA